VRGAAARSQPGTLRGTVPSALSVGPMPSTLRRRSYAVGPRRRPYTVGTIPSALCRRPEHSRVRQSRCHAPGRLSLVDRRNERSTPARRPGCQNSRPSPAPAHTRTCTRTRASTRARTLPELARTHPARLLCPRPAPGPASHDLPVPAPKSAHAQPAQLSPFCRTRSGCCTARSRCSAQSSSRRLPRRVRPGDAAAA
jgi:hypothetical protein